MWDWGTYFLFLFLLIVSYILLYQYDTNYKKENKLLLFWGLLPTFIIFAFRSQSTGIDLFQYELHISQWSSLNDIDFYNFLSEPIFAIIEFLSGSIGGINAFIFLTSGLLYGFIYLAFRSFRKAGIHVSTIFIFLFAFLILRSFNIVRNGLAWACSFYAFTFFFEDNRKSKIKYWLYTLLGLGIHNTSVMNIPIYLTSQVPSGNRKQIYRKLIIRISFIVILAFLVLFYGRHFFFDLFMSLTEERYRASHFEQRDEFGLGNLLFRLPFLVFTLYSIPKLNATLGKKYIPYMIMLFLDIIVSQLRYIAQDFERLAMFTGLGEIILWGMLCMAYSQKRNHTIRYAFLLVGLGYYTYYIYLWAVWADYGPGIGIMPYKTFLF